MMVCAFMCGLAIAARDGQRAEAELLNLMMWCCERGMIPGRYQS